MKQVTDADFRPYGRVLPIDTKEFVKVIGMRPAAPAGTVVYEPNVLAFNDLGLCNTLRDIVFGELPIEFGHCSGFNAKLNALEYHRSSEVDIAATDLVLMLGRQQDIDAAAGTYDTAKAELFFVPAGTAVELYATTLHYAPCGIDGAEFRCGVVLPYGTNGPLENGIPEGPGEPRRLFAVNKWLLAHAESGLEKDGAWIGLTGENLSLK